MSMPPILSTARLVLRPFGPQHLSDRYVSWLNDPETVRYSEQRHRRHTVETCQVWTAAMVKGPHLLWAIEETGTGLGHVGNLAVLIDPQNNLADMSILLGEARGCGLGREAWCAALAWLLGPRRVRKVTAGTMSTNLPMLMLMHRAGMEKDGVRRRHYLLNGQEVDIIFMAAFPNSNR